MQLLESVLVTGLSLGLVYVLFAQGFSCTFAVLASKRRRAGLTGIPHGRPTWQVRS